MSHFKLIPLILILCISIPSRSWSYPNGRHLPFPSTELGRVALYLSQTWNGFLESRALLREEKQIEKLRKKRLKREITRKRNEIRDHRRIVQETLNTPRSPLSSSLKDQMSEIYFDTMVFKKRDFPVLIALGDAERINPFYISRLVKRLCNDGYLIIYDADSKSAPLIREAALKGRRLGISGQAGHEANDILVVENPYLRLKMILSIRDVILSPDSITGLGALIHGMPGQKNSFHIWPAQQYEYLKGLFRWSDQLYSEGVWDPTENSDRFRQSEFSYLSSKNPKPFQGLPSQRANWMVWDEFWKEWKYVFKKLPAFNFRKMIRQIRPHCLEEMVTFAQDYNHLFNETVKGGAVIFGPTSGPLQYADQIREITEEIVKAGMPVITGGCRGCQEFVNRIAYSSSSQSIGIPIDNPDWNLPIEDRAAPDCHDSTVLTRSYLQRIPLLLSSREWVIFLPGGPLQKDTMRELASVLLEIGAGNLPKTPVVFVNRDYYSGLVNWIKELPLPERVRAQIHLIDSREEMQEILSSKPERTKSQSGES